MWYQAQNSIILPEFCHYDSQKVTTVRKPPVSTNLIQGLLCYSPYWISLKIRSKSNQRYPICANTSSYNAF